VGNLIVERQWRLITIDGLKMNRVIERLYSKLEGRGFKGRVVSIKRLQDLQAEIEVRRTQGLFDEGFIRKGCLLLRFTLSGRYLVRATHDGKVPGLPSLPDRMPH